MLSHPSRSALALAATGLLAAACAPQPVAPTHPAPSATPPASPQPSAEPSPAPSRPPSPDPSSQPSAEPEPSATPTPSASAPGDISVVEPTTFNGRVYDDNNTTLDGVTVSVRSLSSAVAFEQVVQTANGSYAVNNAPSGVQIEILASRPGYTTRRRVEVLKSNKQGDPSVNRYDFGRGGDPNDTGSINNALSNLPEVVSVSPGRNASGVAPSTQFTLTFSEPMDIQSVENAFAIRAFNERRLSADSGNTGFTFTGNSQLGSWNGSVNDALIKNAVEGTPVWNKDAFSVNWNADFTIATFSFTAERSLPSDIESSRLPDYRVSFAGFGTGNNIIDKDGNSRNHHHFKLQDGPFEDSYRFSIRTETSQPSITGISARSGGGAGSAGGAIQIRYSKRMLQDAHGVTIAGGMDGSSGSAGRAPAMYPTGSGEASDAQRVAQNYQLRILAGQDAGATKYAGSWGALGGEAHYDTSDVTYKTVLLRAPLAVPVNLGNLNAGDTLSASVLYTDGSSSSLTFTATNAITSLAELQAELNDNTQFGTDQWSANAFQLSGGLTSLQLTLAEAATFQKFGADAKRVAQLTFTGGTAAGAGALNNQRYLAGATLDSAGRWSYFRSGDSVRLSAAATIIDPAGNSLSTTGEVSANAS